MPQWCAQRFYGRMVNGRDNGAMRFTAALLAVTAAMLACSSPVLGPKVPPTQKPARALGSTQERAAPAEPIVVAPADLDAEGKLAASDADTKSAEDEPRLRDAEQKLESALRELAAVAASLEEQRGAAWIRGQLVDGEGQPVVGARIHAQAPQPPRLGIMNPADWSRLVEDAGGLRPQMAWTIKRMARAAATDRYATTGPDGAFALEELEEGEYTLTVQGADYIMDRVSQATGQTVRLTAARIVQHQLDLRLPDGTQPSEAVVTVHGERDVAAAWRWTPEHPSFPSRRKATTISLAAGDLAPLDRTWVGRHQAGPLTLEAETGGTPRITLDEMTQLRVTIQEEEASAPELKFKGALVQASTGRQIELKPTGDRVLSAVGVEPDSYQLQIWRGGGDPEVDEGLTIHPGWNELTVDPGGVDASRFLIVTCRASDGSPVTDLRFVGYSASTSERSANGWIRLKPRANGELWIDPQVFQEYFDRMPDEVTLNLDSASLGKVDAKVPSNSMAFEVEFLRPCDLVVVVDGALVEDLHVSIERRRENGEWRNGPSKEVPTDGRVAFGAISPGEVRLELSVRSRRRNSESIATKVVVLNSGPREVRLMAPELYDLQVMDPGAPKGTRYRLKALDPVSGTWGTSRFRIGRSSEGAVQLSGLLAGTYRLIRYDPPFGEEMEFEVPREGIDEDLSFETIEPTGWKVAGVTKGSVADLAGVEVGDVVTSVDGVEADAEQFLIAMTQEIRDGSVRFTVLRGIVELDLDVELDEIPKPLTLGLGTTLFPVRR